MSNLQIEIPEDIDVFVKFDMVKSVPLAVFSKTWLYLVGINLVVLGIDMVASAGFTYIPPLLLKMGFSLGSMSIIVGLGPLISLVIVPVIGKCSDKSTKKNNKRMPYIVGLSVLLLMSLVLIPYARDICEKLGLDFIGVCVVVTCGVILLDFTTQALLNPCKAWVSDVIIECNSSGNGFTIFSFMLSLGCCLGYYLTSLNWGEGKFGIFVGEQEKAVFLILGILYFVFLSASLILGTQYSFDSTRMKNNNNNNNNNDEEKLACINKPEKEPLAKGKMIGQLIDYLLVIVRTPSVFFKVVYRVLCHPFNCCIYYGSLPPALFQLFLADLFSWMALHSHEIYFTDFVGKEIFQGNPEKGKGRSLYDEGVRWGSWGLLLKSISAAFYAGFVQDKLVRRFGQRATFLFGMLSFTLSMISTLISRSLIVLQLASIVSGFGTAAVTTIPYDILTEYCKYPQMYYPGSSLSIRGIGENMAVLDSASFAAQVLPALFMGFLVDMCGSASVYVIVTATSGLVASILGLYLRYPERVVSE